MKKSIKIKNEKYLIIFSSEKSPNTFQIFALEANKDTSKKTSLFPSYTICQILE